MRLVTPYGNYFPLHSGTNSIGRHPENNIHIDHPQMSRYHALIQVLDEDVILIDLNSTSGTFVNGMEIEAPYPLQIGDRIRFGDEISFTLTSAGVGDRLLTSLMARRLLPVSTATIITIGALSLFTLASNSSGANSMPVTPTPDSIPAAISHMASDSVSDNKPERASPTPPPTLSPALSQNPQPMQTPPALIPPASLTPPPPARSATPKPSPTADHVTKPEEMPADSQFAFAAPVLKGPTDGATFTGAGAQITLSWNPVGPLAADEWYDISVRYRRGGVVQYSGTWTRDTSYRLPGFLFDQADHGNFEWDVTVRRQTGTRPDGGKIGPAIGATSETRHFVWQPGGGESGGEPAPTPMFEKGKPGH